jgi:hypothetical protein
MHACCAVYLLKLAQLYWFLDGPYVTYYANLIQPASHRHFKPAGVAFGVVGVVHTWCGLEMVLLTLWEKQLVLSFEDLSPSQSGPRLWKKLKSIKRRVAVASSTPTISAFSGIVGRVRIWWSSWFGRKGVFGLEGVCFDLLFLTREFVETALQSFQARQMSEMIATVWLNRFFVLLVVANCWTTPLVQRIARHHPGLGRLTGIAIDLTLSVGTNMVIPAIIFVPYFQVWRRENYSFDAELVYDDLWFSNLVMENRLLFARSLIDFIAKLFPHVSVLHCLACIKTLVVRVHGVTTKIESVVPLSDEPPIPRVSAATPSPHMSRFRLGGWKTRVVHTVLVVWGFTLLGLHLSASRVKPQDALGGCKQSIRVWFATKNTCTTYEYNCYRRRDDSGAKLATALQEIEPSTLLTLIVTHCRELVVPREIQHFDNLLTLELFNVTLLDWPSSAAISPAIHTSLVALILACVNMTALPDGVRGPLPDSLSDIEIAYSNLTTLPDDLHKSWHPLDVLYFEFSAVTEFPPTLTRLAVNDLSLFGNQLTTIPLLAELPYEMYTLVLTQNPLQELPPAVHSQLAIGYLSVEDTQLTALPPWANDSRIVRETVFAKRSPVCTAMTTSLSAWSEAAWPRIDCERGDPRADSRYPLAIMLPRRVP